MFAHNHPLWWHWFKSYTPKSALLKLLVARNSTIHYVIRWVNTKIITVRSVAERRYLKIEFGRNRQILQFRRLSSLLKHPRQ